MNCTLSVCYQVRRFIAEYVKVMRPVCNAVDKLQGKSDVGLVLLAAAIVCDDN